jgi:hypothetical protein
MINELIDMVAIVLGFAAFAIHWIAGVMWIAICFLCWIFCDRMGEGCLGLTVRNSRWKVWRTGDDKWYRMGR